MDSKRDAMKKLMAADFAAYDLQLFLDTHPDDKEAMALYTDAVRKAALARNEYEANYFPVTAAGAAGKMPWQWIVSPWTWE